MKELIKELAGLAIDKDCAVDYSPVYNLFGIFGSEGKPNIEVNLVDDGAPAPITGGN